MPQWFEYGPTHLHSPGDAQALGVSGVPAGDDGMDIGTPNDTPVWFPYPGTVIDAEYFDYGGQVAVDTGLGFIEYFIHLDEIKVNPGEHVTPGQQIGTTGGGIGDLVLHEGSVQPAEDMSWYNGHSTGYHTEFGEFAGSTLEEFNQGWHNPPRQLDPTAVIVALRKGQPVPEGGSVANVVLDPALQASSQANGSNDPFQGFPPGFQGVYNILTGTADTASQMNPAGWARAIPAGIVGGVGGVLQSMLSALGFADIPDFMVRSTVFIAGGILILTAGALIVVPVLRRDDRSLDAAILDRLGALGK